MAMAERACERSLWSTLTAAVSTFGLFTATNWGSASLIGDTHSQGLFKQLADHAIFVFAMPVLAIHLSLLNALKVWAVKQALRLHFQDHQELCPKHSSISIITLCPIYIQIPLIEPHELDEHLTQYKPVAASELEKLCPLRLYPNPQDDGVSNTYDNLMPDRWIYLKLPPTHEVQDARERYALLASGLAPKDAQLAYLRSRRLFQSIVTALQAFGYMLGVAERMVQHLSISPVEAIVAFLSILTILQLLIEPYACGIYQRPLLLILQQHECMRFGNVVRKDLDFLLTWKQNSMFWAIFVPLGFLVGCASLYYMIHYSQICSVAAVLFFLALFMYCFLPKDFLIYSPIGHGKTTALLCMNFFFVCSLIFAMIATAADWEVFQEAAHQSLAQIFPHVSS